ncbi:MAG: ComF family protein [Gemmatimonadetes bacterium]|nr:ComF family protein [Gemmatimonadota bacterium]MBI3566793.1 ComF family protein [Gemmatimonadota bacterium]
MERGAALIDGVVELLLPRCCAACGGAMTPERDALVCGTCWARLPVLPHPQCPRCGHPTGARTCPFCELLPPYVRAVRSVCWVPHATSSAVVSALKYDGWPAVASGMARRMARTAWPADVVAERAALLPVPLDRDRQRERGFNQAGLLADALSLHWRVPAYHDVLERTRATATQTRLTPGERSANVHEAFRVADGERIRGRHLVLVDDVITTGATLNACAAALFRAGARILSYVTFGRARTSGDR